MHGFKRAIVFIGSVQWDWEQHFALGQLPHQEKFVTLFAELRRVGVMPYEAWQTWERIGAVSGFKKSTLTFLVVQVLMILLDPVDTW